MKHVFAGLLVVMVMCASAAAPARVRADDKAHRAAILQLFALMDMNNVMAQSTEAMLGAQVQANPSLAPYSAKFREFFAKYMSWASLQDEFVAIYAKSFTEAEVKQLVAFYNTPIGKKALREMPQLMQKGAQIGAARVQQHMPELMQMLQEAKKAQ